MESKEVNKRDIVLNPLKFRAAVFDNTASEQAG